MSRIIHTFGLRCCVLACIGSSSSPSIAQIAPEKKDSSEAIIAACKFSKGGKGLLAKFTEQSPKRIVWVIDKNESVAEGSLLRLRVGSKSTIADEGDVIWHFFAPISLPKVITASLSVDERRGIAYLAVLRGENENRTIAIQTIILEERMGDILDKQVATLKPPSSERLDEILARFISPPIEIERKLGLIEKVDLMLVENGLQLGLFRGAETESHQTWLYSLEKRTWRKTS